MNSIPLIVITGPCGVGKTTVAFAVGELLGARNVPHAVVDMDSLRNCYPSPQNDPFHVQLGFRNLAAIWGNYRQVGTEYLVLADIVEIADAGDDYQRAVPNSQIVIVRLRASQAEIERRLRGRETAASLEWYLNRSAELSELMEARHIGDFVIETDGRDIGEIADEILAKAGSLANFSEKKEIEEAWRVCDHFFLIPNNPNKSNEAEQSAQNGENIRYRTGVQYFDFNTTDYPKLAVSDDVINYLQTAWQWIPVPHSYKSGEFLWGLNLYAWTILTAEPAKHFARICEAYVQLFSQAVEQPILPLGFSCPVEGCEEGEQCELNYFKVNRDELLSQLQTLADWGRKAATGEYYILHNGV